MTTQKLRRAARSLFPAVTLAAIGWAVASCAGDEGGKGDAAAKTSCVVKKGDVSPYLCSEYDAGADGSGAVIAEALCSAWSDKTNAAQGYSGTLVQGACPDAGKVLGCSGTWEGQGGAADVTHVDWGYTDEAARQATLPCSLSSSSKGKILRPDGTAGTPLPRVTRTPAVRVTATTRATPAPTPQGTSVVDARADTPMPVLVGADATAYCTGTGGTARAFGTVYVWGSEVAAQPGQYSYQLWYCDGRGNKKQLSAGALTVSGASTGTHPPATGTLKFNGETSVIVGVFGWTVASETVPLFRSGTSLCKDPFQTATCVNTGGSIDIGYGLSVSPSTSGLAAYEMKEGGTQASGGVLATLLLP